MAANISASRMRQAQLSAKRTAKTASVPAPIGGWNARDALASMDEKDAIKLENFWPFPYDVMVRKGYTQHTTGLPGQVESLMTYSNPTTQTLFAACGTGFYNVGAGGAVGAAVVTGLTNARWQHVNVATSGGNFLLAVNGLDKLRGWNGTAWWADGDGTHDITGVNTANCYNITLFKNRVWLIEKNSLKVWYLPTDSIAGAANSLNFQSVARKGGYLLAMGTWTIDAGYGVDDLAVFLTSMGEVIVYRGIDPSNSVTWALAGIWQMGPAFTPRCLMKWGGDLLLLTIDGLYPLAQYLQSSRLNPKIALSDKIYSALSEATANYNPNFGWGLEFFPKANMLILNVPLMEGASQQQYCMNTITGAWTNFTGIGANCWAIFNDDPYFGGNGYVGKFWNSLSDDGANIVGNAKQAFNYFKMRGQTKRWTMIRPTLRTNGTPTALISVNVDFSDFDPTGELVFAGTSSGLWDAALWDTGLWGADLNVSNIWQGVNGQGYCCAVRLKVAAAGIETHWASTDFVMEGGGVL